MYKETIMPTCTHCDYEFDDDELWHPWIPEQEVDTSDGGFSEVVCPSCRETFYVSCRHHIRFRNVDEDGDEIN